MLEKEIEKKLVKGVQKISGFCFKWVSPGRDGVPDRIILLPEGKIIFAELKTEKGKLSGRQEFMIKLIRALGFDVRVIYGMPQVNELLAELQETGAGGM